MQQARDVCVQLHGATEEAALYEQFQHDIDEYIYQACYGIKRGIQCKKCKRMACTVQLLQTRSADEGMTAYLVCSACRHRTCLG